MRSSTVRRLIRRFLAAALLGAAFAPVVAFAAEDRVIVVLNSGDATISIVDPVSLKTLGTIDTGKDPHHLMATPGGKEVIIASSAGNSLMFLDSKSRNVQRIVRGIDDPYQLAFSPDRKWFAVTCLRLNRVDIYEADSFRLVRRIPLAKLPSSLESFQHANVRLSFGRWGERLLVSPRFHRRHHAIGDGHEGLYLGCNFAVLFPIWDDLFGTSNREAGYPATGIRDQLANGAEPGRNYGRGFWSQQWLGLLRMIRG